MMKKLLLVCLHRREPLNTQCCKHLSGSKFFLELGYLLVPTATRRYNITFEATHLEPFKQCLQECPERQNKQIMNCTECC